MKKKRMVICISLFLILLPMLTGYAADTSFYEGKVVTLIVATDPGGNFDFYARQVAQFMKQYLPGCKAIIIKNVPGAGHITGAMTIARSKPDGLTIGLFSSAVISAQLGGFEGANLDLANQSWLGATGMGIFSILCSVKKAKNWEEFKKADKLIVGSSGPGSSAYSVVKLMADMAGLKNIVMLGGYGGSEADIGMMRGDLDVIPATGSGGGSFDLVKQGIAVPIVFTGNMKLKGYEHVPILKEIFPEEKYQPIVDYCYIIASSTRQFSGPPGIPPERLQLLREAFRKAVHNPEYEANMLKTGQNAGYMSGEDIERRIKNTLNMAPEYISMIKATLKATK